MVAAVRVTNRSGAPVTQPTRVTSVTSLGVKQPTVEHPDDESSEWLSEWGDAPAGPSGFGPSKLRPGWKGGGEAPGPHDGRFRALPATASRGRPVPTAPRVSHEPHSLGIAGVEATLRRWLVTNRRVHEPRRLTLLRMLGRGLKGGTDSSLDRRTRFDPNDEYRHMDEENELVTDTDDDVHNATFTRGKTVNGLPVDAKGRPVGLKNASFPDPKYHAIDEETSEPLPLEERKRFVPSLPPSKRVYHPLGGRPGPRIRDGTWDSPIDVPRSLDLNDEPLDDRSAAAKRRPAVVMTKAQFARACALGGTPLSASDVDEVFAKYGRVSGGARSIDPNKTTAMSLELEAFAETIVSMPQRALGAKPHRALDDSPVNSMALRSESAEGKSVTKIVYPPCRTGVFAPSDWDDYYARRSADAPKEDLAAEWAYGCSVAGKCGMLAAAPKTWTDEPTRKTDDANDADESMDEWMNPGGYRGVVWVYACGAMGVVFDANAWRQRFFRGHDDEITSLTTHSAGRWAATGQRSGRAPCACIWEIATGKEVARLRHEPGERAVVAIAFGPGTGDPHAPGGGGAARIVTVASDSRHTVRVWDWGGGHPGRPTPCVLTVAVGFAGTPPQVFGATWAPDADRFATFGVKHVKLWTAAEDDKLSSSRGSRPQGADAAAAAAAGRRRAESARNAASARGANAAAVEYAGRVCVYGSAARVCAREFGAETLNVSTKGSGTLQTATASDALCGAFIPGCRGQRLVTGHVDGKLYVWLDRRCARVVDAHGGFAVRALTVQMTMRERAAAAMTGFLNELHAENENDENADAYVQGTPSGLGVEIITGAQGGLVRRWDVIEDWAIVRAETLGNEAAIPRETPRGFFANSNSQVPGGKSVGVGFGKSSGRASGRFGASSVAAPAPNVRAVAAAGDEIAAVTSAGDLWLVWDGEEEALPAVIEEEENDDAAWESGELPPAALPRPLARGQSGAALAVAWHPHWEGVFACASDSPRIVVRDAIARDVLGTVWVCDPRPAKATALAFSPAPATLEDGFLLAVGTNDGEVRVFRLLEGRVRGKRQLVGRPVAIGTHRLGGGPITALAFSPDGNVIAAGGHDRCVSLHEVVTHRAFPGASGTGRELPDIDLVRRARCKGHSSTVVSIDWSNDSSSIRSTCRGYEILHFTVPSGRQAVGDFRDATWHEWTSPLGFQVMGVFGGGQNGSNRKAPRVEGSDVNSVSRAGARNLLAVGDDFGRVRLLNYPCVAPGAPANEQLEAHSNKVACVRFSPDAGDNKWLVSAGGEDRALVQWRLVNEDGDPVGDPVDHETEIEREASAREEWARETLREASGNLREEKEGFERDEVSRGFDDGMSTGGSLEETLFASGGAEGADLEEDFDEDEVFGALDPTVFGLPGVAEMLHTRRPSTAGPGGPEAYRKQKMDEINAQMDSLLRTARPVPPRRERRSLRERRLRETAQETRVSGEPADAATEAEDERRRAMAELTASPPAPRRRAAASARASIPPPPLVAEESFSGAETTRAYPSLDDDDEDAASPDPLAAAPSRAQLLMSGTLPPMSEDAAPPLSEREVRELIGEPGRSSPPAFPHLAPSHDPLSPPSASDEDEATDEGSTTMTMRR